MTRSNFVPINDNSQTILIPKTNQQLGLSLAIGLGISSILGCNQQREARVYIAPKTETEWIVAPPGPVNAPFLSGNSAGNAASGMQTSSIPNSKKRILGAILPMHGAAFFLKITDSIDRIETIQESFAKVVQEFQADSQTSLPTSSLPSEWTLQPGDAFAAAKIAIPVQGGKPLTMTVTRLEAPTDAAQWDQYVETQVNRWLGQLGRKPWSAEEMLQNLKSGTRSDLPAPYYLFDQDGASAGTASSTQSASPKQSEPVPPSSIDASSSRSGDADPAGAGSEAMSGKDPSPRIEFETPTGWESQPPSPFRLASFRIPTTSTGEKAIDGEVSVSMAVDSPLENCRMWAKQVHQIDDETLLAVHAEKAIESATPIESGNKTGKLYSLRSSESADALSLLIAVLPTDKPEMSLFVKLRSDTQMSIDQKENLIRFVNSLRWE